MQFYLQLKLFILTTFIQVIATTKQYSTVSYAEHFCQLFNSTAGKYLELQALTIDNRQLYLMHSDNLYIIPRENLNSTDNVLYMYNITTGKQYRPVKWFEVVGIDKLKSLAAKHQPKNGPGKLATWQLFAVDRWHAVPPTRYNLLMSYVFKGDSDTAYDELLIDRLIGRVLYDSTDNNTVGNPSIDYKLQARHLPFRAIIDGQNSTRGYLFHYDKTDADAAKSNRPKRVLIDVLYRKPSAPGALDFINFPLNDNQWKTGAYIQVKSEAHARSEFNLLKYGSGTAKGYKNQDFFHHLPLGFIGPHSEVYLFSEAEQRVYRIDYFNLTLDKALPKLNIIADKQWAEFFICSPKQKVKRGKDLSPSMTQGEYLVYADSWERRNEVHEVHSMWTAKFMVGLVGLGLLIATVLCLTMLRIRKLRLDELREQANALKMLSTNM
ncbi:hypothetical protein TYRP_014260 [Tyrophagus putrescentiae]|nr:hypothetical protein TYRP_014260 [Tyrophagus putrescentiae]